MKKITAYEVFSVETPLELEKYVNQKIGQGWQPHGSIHAAPDGKGGLLFIQAVVKYEN